MFFKVFKVVHLLVADLTHKTIIFTNPRNINTNLVSYHFHLFSFTFQLSFVNSTRPFQINNLSFKSISFTESKTKNIMKNIKRTFCGY